MAALATKHVGLVIAVIPLVVVAVRLEAISRWQTTTALGVISSQGTLAVFVGALLPLIPLAIFAAYAYTTGLHWKAEGGPVEWVSGIIAAIFSIVVLAYLPWPLVSVFAVGTLLILVADRRRPERRDEAILAGVVVFALLIVLGGNMWLPAEKLRLAGQSRPTVGYVLKEGGRWTSILIDEDRKIVVVESQRVKRRELCAPSYLFGNEPSIGSLVFGEDHPAYPDC